MSSDGFSEGRKYLEEYPKSGFTSSVPNPRTLETFW
jgi:hypothetical protein